MTFTKAILNLSIEDSFGKCKFLNCPFINSFISILADFFKRQMDVVVDCHCFKLRYNLDPRMVVGIAELLRQPYRDRLRLVGSDKNGEVKWGLGVGKIQTGHGKSYERQAMSRRILELKIHQLTAR